MFLSGEPPKLSEMLTRQLRRTEIDLFLPKFKIESSLDLIPVLRQMGLDLVFDPSQSDLSGIVHTAGNERVFVLKVIHKAVMKVDETGTEAAAATAVIMLRAVSTQLRKPPPQVRFDHPFSVFIVERKEKVVLFAGSVQRPQWEDA